ncbi:MAG TPA: hypothetical protein VD713_02315, partial [Sphingomonadales bacterium]|nr:hypothetical protein [Sphingomonadales bacterium]
MKRKKFGVVPIRLLGALFALALTLPFVLPEPKVGPGASEILSPEERGFAHASVRRSARDVDLANLVWALDVIDGRELSAEG